MTLPGHLCAVGCPAAKALSPSLPPAPERYSNQYSDPPFYETVDKMTAHCIKTYLKIQFHLNLY